MSLGPKYKDKNSDEIADRAALKVKNLKRSNPGGLKTLLIYSNK
jgi:Cu/Ag efflux pump CusA